MSVSVPVSASDATRCEALGPVLISLLLARFPAGYVHLQGDSKYVCDLLSGIHTATDIHLSNCCELVKDVLQ